MEHHVVITWFVKLAQEDQRVVLPKSKLYDWSLGLNTWIGENLRAHVLKEGKLTLQNKKTKT